MCHKAHKYQQADLLASSWGEVRKTQPGFHVVSDIKEGHVSQAYLRRKSEELVFDFPALQINHFLCMCATRTISDFLVLNATYQTKFLARAHTQFAFRT